MADSSIVWRFLLGLSHNSLHPHMKKCLFRTLTQIFHKRALIAGFQLETYTFSAVFRIGSKWCVETHAVVLFVVKNSSLFSWGGNVGLFIIYLDFSAARYSLDVLLPTDHNATRGSPTIYYKYIHAYTLKIQKLTLNCFLVVFWLSGNVLAITPDTQYKHILA